MAQEEKKPFEVIKKEFGISEKEVKGVSVKIIDTFIDDKTNEFGDFKLNNVSTGNYIIEILLNLL